MRLGLSFYALAAENLLYLVSVSEVLRATIILKCFPWFLPVQRVRRVQGSSSPRNVKEVQTVLGGAQS